MATTEKKVYDYKPELVRDRLVEVFRKRKGEATTADLVALTGLPKAQVEAELKPVSDEYGARLRVTESGEILYSFPQGMRSRYRGLGPSLRRFWKAFKKGAAAAAVFLFKIWIVGMLVGYFVLFLALALLAMLASVAVSMSGKDDRSDRRGGGIGGLYLTGRLLDAFVRIWFYSELFKDPYQRSYERGLRAERRREKKPLHRAIFSFVFGDGDPNADWESVEKKAVVAFLQANKGVVTMPEFMALTGLPSAEAERRINRYLLEFEGEPAVSPGGAIYYFFPGLLRRKDRADRTYGGSLPMKRLAAFSANPKKANAWFCAINGANTLFGGYFLGMSLAAQPLLPILYGGQYADRVVLTRGFDFFYLFTHQLFGKVLGVGDPSALLGLVLGAVPLAFSFFFYLVPVLRSRRLKAANERVKLENLRRVAYGSVLAAPGGVRPESVPVADEAARPRDSRAAERLLKELAAAAGGEPGADGSYAFPEIARGQAEAGRVRAAVREEDYALGAAVFDSDS